MQSNWYGNDSWAGPLYPQIPVRPSVAPDCPHDSPCLFDVVADAGEHFDIAKDHPDLVRSMAARLQELEDSSKGCYDPPNPNVTSAQVCQMTADNGGFLTPADWRKMQTQTLEV